MIVSVLNCSKNFIVSGGFHAGDGNGILLGREELLF